MSRVVIICPASVSYMPYMKTYTDILRNSDIDYTVLSWDRQSTNDASVVSFRPKYFKSTALCYAEYTLFISRYLRKNRKQFLIIFSNQLLVYLLPFIIKHKFLIDIRDYSHEKNPIFKRLAEIGLARAQIRVISSLGFKSWLPSNLKYTYSPNISHIDKNDTDGPQHIQKEKFIISYIGAIGYYSKTVEFIEKIAKSRHIELNIIGRGIDSEKIHQYVIENGIDNVTIRGAYVPEEKRAFYERSDFILIYYGSGTPLLDTSLPNKLYEAAQYGKPIIAHSGTLVANIVETYHLGIVVDPEESEDVESKIMKWAQSPKNSEEFLRDSRLFIDEELKYKSASENEILNLVSQM